ncbi:hypothetical protein [Paraburkholderia kirstenboschensis]|uniref:Lipoprotein n=1 Tax=Paraburkholderia kirstenboschensis TaxID=1245436 RepID=A0ABZ0EJS5_9BURK|nr:hypothetical protein [Paraburkholderia kirstenboschensis]WOD17175.1 hypothetical protein RW095_15240 [Paraburkholderia kirstenboschensis]
MLGHALPLARRRVAPTEPTTHTRRPFVESGRRMPEHARFSKVLLSPTRAPRFAILAAAVAATLMLAACGDKSGHGPPQTTPEVGVET